MAANQQLFELFQNQRDEIRKLLAEEEMCSQTYERRVDALDVSPRVTDSGEGIDLPPALRNLLNEDLSTSTWSSDADTEDDSLDIKYHISPHATYFPSTEALVDHVLGFRGLDSVINCSSVAFQSSSCVLLLFGEAEYTQRCSLECEEETQLETIRVRFFSQLSTVK